MNNGQFELIWARVTRVVSFVVGIAIMSYETVGDHSERPWLYAAAIGMMGLPIARVAEGVLSHWGGSGPQSNPAGHIEVKPETPTDNS